MKRITISVALQFALLAANSAAQNGAPDERQKMSDLAGHIAAIEQKLDQQQQEIESLKQQLATRDEALRALRTMNGSKEPETAIARPADASTEPKLVVAVAAGPVTTTRVESATVGNVTLGQEPQANAEGEAPLQLRIGTARITPIGFVDLGGYYRSHTVGSGLGTNFGSIPYGDSFQTNLSEFRFTMQTSRIGFRVDADIKGAHALGYMEADFLGNNPGNVAVSVNSNTFRSRLAFLDVKKGKWELLAGQTWSLLTPGRRGISPLPADVFYTQGVDPNHHVGLFFGRIPEFRVVYHASKQASFAVALSSPEQYIGGSTGGGVVTFPSALQPFYPGGELNNGNTTLAVPNSAPDVIVKAAFDPSQRVHFEIGGIERDFRLFNPNTSQHFSAVGGGAFANLHFDIAKGLRLLTNNFWSDGGGRYIFAQAPDLIARVDGSPSLVHASSTIDGLEYTHKNLILYTYYGGSYIGRDSVFDANGKPVGYGYAGSPSGQNRTIQQATLGFTRTIWKDPRYGTVNLMTQYSYITRSPWSVAPGQPKDAHLNMTLFALRYLLPGAPPAGK